MQKMTSRFRLSSSAFERADEKNKSEPKKMVILSVEGDETECTYFQHLNEHLDNTMIQIEVLRHRRGDGDSDPTQVIELLDEFWLLLHLCDVKSEFSDDDLEALRLNHPISNRHTRVSLEVSKRAHHNKTISAKKFEEYYFTQIPQAIVNAGQFVTEFPQLLDNLGTNLPKLFDQLNYTERRLQ